MHEMKKSSTKHIGNYECNKKTCNFKKGYSTLAQHNIIDNANSYLEPAKHGLILLQVSH